MEELPKVDVREAVEDTLSSSVNSLSLLFTGACVEIEDPGEEEKAVEVVYVCSSSVVELVGETSSTEYSCPSCSTPDMDVELTFNLLISLIGFCSSSVDASRLLDMDRDIVRLSRRAQCIRKVTL